ncbi:MAG: hypothetical protein LBI14_00715 [Treponema sp.]|jgi:hypothetical protein|nr:hypothetical protein [Treponema sp.]
MSGNVTIFASGIKEDIQKLWDVLSEPNKYGGIGIKLDRNSVHPLEGPEGPIWEAIGETVNMPKELLKKNDFNDLYADFPALSIKIYIYSVYSVDGEMTVRWVGPDMPTPPSGKVNIYNYDSFLTPEDREWCDKIVEALTKA